MEAVHLKIFPRACVDFVLSIVELRKVNEYGYGASGDVPTSNAYCKAFALGKNAPLGEELFVFGEEGIFFSAPNVGANKNQIIAKLLFESFSAAGEDGVYAADFVTYFPTGFENDVGKSDVFCHEPIKIFYLLIVVWGPLSLFQVQSYALFWFLTQGK